ncbi:RHS repeat-associated core domain-containing protein [Tychonema sp. BBK16]|uniref:RHS repeat-associated core domain-containing protein n=1 Tax=Tychonema sp. BBK16 TaxID=2699888 RepID=UPI0038D33000
MTLAALYVLGDDRISQYRPAAGATPASTRHYHADGLGSTRLLTTTTGAITDRYHYQAFGELDTPASTMTSDNRFLFTGEQLDPNTGFYYLRARYVNPGDGRFTQQDGFAGFSQDPTSLHKYLYANNDPVGRVDPRGNFAFTWSAVPGMLLSSIGRTVIYNSVVKPVLKRVAVALAVSAATYVATELRKKKEDREIPIIVFGFDVKEATRHYSDAISMNPRSGTLGKV